MDRAHRLGQRKVVNVYRLIAAESIEQRVLRLQGHKLEVASAVVSQENSSAFARGTGEVLGMLGEAAGVQATTARKKGLGGAPSGARAGGAATGEQGDGDTTAVDGEGGAELWSADEDYAYLSAERLADSVAKN